MSLQNQIYLHSLETKDFYTDEEFELNELYFESLRLRKELKDERTKIEGLIMFIENKQEEEGINQEELDEYNYCIERLEVLNNQLELISSEIKEEKENLDSKINEFNGIRVLREEAFKSNTIVGLFESSLTRTCGFITDEVTKDMMIIRIFHYSILNSIIHNGFIYNGEKYEYLTSSAGQIRTKKIVCIKSSLYAKHVNTITCGLSVEEINKRGGVNTNKYQAYLALANSASEVWKKFNIDRMIVVDDIETLVRSEVDHIDEKTFGIERKVMDIPIEHMDGCGIMLPTVAKKSRMIRMPWVKGLLAPMDFRKFIEEFGGNPVVKDIYGKEWNVIEDNINVILTKSQFKMWKFYDSWEDYKTKFKEYNCEACAFNIEDIGSKASINYQMLQTLTSMTKEEMIILAQETINDIHSLGNDKKTMLRVLGAVKENKRMNAYQKSLLLYPELLSDSHSREVIKSKKASLVNDARAGKITVNGYYTYIIPDLFAFCEWLFLGDNNPKGLLQNNDVYCNIFNEGEVDVLRAPHLYKEHAIRNNVKNEMMDKWFITKGIYTSVHDPISKILQFDVDGDKALVVQDTTLINVAKRDMEGVVPLYYEMSKAKDTPITNDLIYTALTSAYKANIGIISNEITKIWNNDKPNVDAVKWLCMLNNFTID